MSHQIPISIALCLTIYNGKVRPKRSNATLEPNGFGHKRILSDSFMAFPFKLYLKG